MKLEIIFMRHSRMIFHRKRNQMPSAISYQEKSSRESNVHLRLPVINIPSFSGNISDWPSFRDSFVSLIHENEELSDVQRFHYLKSALRGSPAQTISAIQISQIGYTTAWDALLNGTIVLESL